MLTDTTGRYEVVLQGCRPSPLSSYLKALGVLRLVAEQVDPLASGCWRQERFVLISTLDQAGLLAFLLESYAPSPLVAPWNGGSGFGVGDNRVGFTPLRTASHRRFTPYRQAISAGLAARRQFGLVTEQSSTWDELTKKELTLQAEQESARFKAAKVDLLQLCRATLPDEALSFLDAAVLLTNDRPRFPPLLGTGGNDGRLDFTSNFMQRLCELLDTETGEPLPGAATFLRATLFGVAVSGLLKGKSPGQFSPGAAGGTNQSSGFDGASSLNGWDFILMLEGAITMAGSVSRKLGDASPSKAAFPFTVNPTSAGLATGTDSEEASSRGEIWLPLWQQPIRYTELLTLLSEGRARVGRRQARNGVDFARAVSTLGVARGIDAFERVGFQNRNGKAFFAVPQGRFVVCDRPEVRWLEDISAWLDSFRRFARDKTAPARAGRALRQLENAVLNLCQGDASGPANPGLVGALLHALAIAEASLWPGGGTKSCRPLPPLRRQWSRGADDGSVEFRLGRALAMSWGPLGKQAQAPLRHALSPTAGTLVEGKNLIWRHADRDVVSPRADLITTLLAVLQRRLLGVQRGATGHTVMGGAEVVSLADLTAFIAGRCDDARTLAWARALSLVAPPLGKNNDFRQSWPHPDARHAQLALCFAAAPVRGVEVPLDARIARLAAAGRGDAALVAARRRLHSAGLRPLTLATPLHPDRARRMAAALLLPLNKTAIAHLADRALQPPPQGVAISPP